MRLLHREFGVRRTGCHGRLARPCRFSALLLAALASSVAAAQDRGVEVVDLSIGFAGTCRVGSWAPVRVTLSGGGQSRSGHVELVVPDGDGVPSRVSRPVVIPAAGNITVTLYVRFGRVHDDVDVRFVDNDGGVVARKTFQTGEDEAGRNILTADREFIVAVGYSIGLEEAIKLRKQDEFERSVVAQLDSTDQLPTRWYGYEGVDFVVLGTGNLEAYRNLTADTAQAVALDEWVRRGGRLVLCVAKNAPSVLAARNPLGRFSPGRFSPGDMTTLRSDDTGDLEEYSGQDKPIASTDDVGLGLLVPWLKNVDGRVEVTNGADLPLVVRSAYGFGEVVFVALDLDLPPLSRWEGRGRVVNKLLGHDTTGKKDSGQQDDVFYNYGGYEDHAGQLRSALDQFTGIRLVPFSVVAGLVFLYVLMIGPVDYFVLKKFFKRMEYTWITFPLIVLVFSVGSYALAYWLKGDQIRINQIDLVDVDVESGAVRGVTWVNLFSPRTDGYDFSIRPQSLRGGDAVEAEVLFSWMGMPGRALGGMDSPADGLSFFDAYDFDPQLDGVRRMPVAVWSTKSLTARWHDQLAGDAPFAATLQADALGLQGEITSRLDFPLSDCVMLYGGSAYLLDEIEPGEAVVFNRQSSHRSISTFWKSEIAGAINDPYRGQNLVAEDSIRAMMFHRLVNGEDFTHLRNRYQGFVDLSTHVEVGRAILVCRRSDDRHAAQLVDGETDLGKNPDDQHTTLYRFVFRVEE